MKKRFSEPQIVAKLRFMKVKRLNRKFLSLISTCLLVTASICVAQNSKDIIKNLSGEDGEGTARIVSPRYLFAGSKTSIVIEVQIGPSGIPVGGGVTVGLHHAAHKFMQVTDSEKNGYTIATCDTPGNLKLKWYEWAPSGSFPDVMKAFDVLPRDSQGQRMLPDSIFHNCVFALVQNKPLKAGEVITFVIGAGKDGMSFPVWTDKNFEFRITTDVNGDGVFKGIALSPKIDILPQKANHLAASVPATLTIDQNFEMQIRAEDEFNNVASDYNGSVNVCDEKGNIVLKNIALHNGIGKVSTTIKYAGPQRFRISDGTLTGRSNPCRVFSKVPKNSIYWGDIHGHTNISDGLGDSAYDYFKFGRDVADLDVCALTDHGHFDWPQTIDAVQKYYEPGKYVTILGQEAGAGQDHMNLYFRDDDTPHIKRWATKIDEFYNIIYEQYNKDTERPEVITGPHHFSFDRGDDRYPFGLFDTRTARFVEVYSAHGTSEYLDNPRPLPGARDKSKFLQYGLAKGLRFGVIASSDTHDSHVGRSRWGSYPGGFVAFISPELTRESIWDSFWSYKVYGSSFDRIYMEFTINSKLMGSELVLNPEQTCLIHYYVIGKSDNLKVFLIKNNEEYRIDETVNGVVEVNIEDTLSIGENFYYLRVVQDNGERAWSTPIWVTVAE